MDIFAFAERLMAMDDVAWARHANPKSGWSRIFGGVFIFMAAWSAFWIGWWSAIPIALVMIWTYVNPRLFAPPRHTNAWATKAVLGERVFLNRKSVPIPEGFVRANWITTSVSIVFILPTVWGFISRDMALAATGWSGVMVGKFWFIDRCAWLWEEMKDADERYRKWNLAKWDLKD